jgi:hypothetical protein
VVDGTVLLLVDEHPNLDQSFDVPTIKELIRSALDSGKSVRDLAEDSGQRVKFQTFQELSNYAPKQFPKDPKTIVGMALALKVSETAIVLAFASSLGISVATGSNLAMRLPADVDKLSPEMQDAIINLTRAALKAPIETNLKLPNIRNKAQRRNPG